MKERDKQRQAIMKSVRQVVLKPLPEPYDELPNKPFFKPIDSDPVVAFAENFTESGGQFMYCQNLQSFLLEVVELTKTNSWNNVYCWEKRLYNQWFEMGFNQCKTGRQLLQVDAGVCLCECLVASNGSIILSNRHSGALRMLSEAPNLIVLANIRKAMPTLNHAITYLKQQQFNHPITHWVSVNGANNNHPLFEMEYNQIKAQNIYVFLID